MYLKANDFLPVFSTENKTFSSFQKLIILIYIVRNFICYFNIFSLVDRYTLDAFADSGFDFPSNSLDNEDALLYRFMKEFNHSAAADNPIAGLASK